MKKSIVLSFILILLLPAGLWLRNLYTHQLGAEEIRREVSASTWFAELARQMVPFQGADGVLGIAQTSRYAYRFVLEEGLPRLKWSDSVGEDAKLVLPRGDDFILVSQENGIRFRSIQIFRYDPLSREAQRLNEPELVTGLFSNNAVIHNDWVYYWYHTLAGEIYAVAFGDGAFHEFALPERMTPELDGIGFNLTYPKIANCPVLEISRNGERVYYALAGANPPQPSRGNHPLDGAVTEGRLAPLQSRGEYSRFWLTGDFISALQGRMVHVYRLPDLQRVDEFHLADSNIHSLIYREGLVQAIPDNASASARADIVRGYEAKASLAKFQLERYIREERFRNYIATPTSLGLILLQMALLALGWRVLKSPGEVQP